MKIQIITLFPEMFEGVLNNSMMWKAQNRSAVEFSYINLRDYGIGPRKQVDDTPYGGGDGMLEIDTAPLQDTLENEVRDSFAAARPGTDAVLIPAGSLDVDAPILPQGRIFTGSAARWACTGDELPAYPEYPAP